MTARHEIQPGVEMHSGDSVALMAELSAQGFQSPLVLFDPPYGINWQAAGHGAIALDQNPFLATRTFIPPAAALMTEDAVMAVFSRIDVAPVWERQMTLSGLAVQPRMTWDKQSPWHDARGVRDEVLLIAFRGQPAVHIDDGANLLSYPLPRAKQDKADSPTPKPVAMMKYLIEKYTQPGDVVLDPCAGEAPVGVAAIATGRRYVGCEFEPGRAEAAVRRLELERDYQVARGRLAGLKRRLTT